MKKTKVSNFFAILEIKETATKAEIIKAYHKQALRWHPDKNPTNLKEATKKFQEIQEAYEKLLEFIKKRTKKPKKKTNSTQKPRTKTQKKTSKSKPKSKKSKLNKTKKSDINEEFFKHFFKFMNNYINEK